MKCTCSSKDEKWGKWVWPTDQGEGQCHFHRKLQMLPGSTYTSNVAWRSFRPCHLPQSFTVLSYYLPGTHRGKRQKITPMPFNVHLPISLSYFILLVKLFLFQSQPLTCCWNSELLFALHWLQMSRNGTARFTFWPLTAPEYTSDTSNLASFTCSLAGETDVQVGKVVMMTHEQDVTSPRSVLRKPSKTYSA